MDNKLNKLIDDLMLQTLVKILEEVDSTGMNIFPVLATTCAKHGMPVANIPSFLLELAKYIVNTFPEEKQSSVDTNSLRDLLSSSGFLTIGFSQDQEEGDQ